MSEELQNFIKAFSLALEEAENQISRSWGFYDSELDKAKRNVKEETIREIRYALDSLL